MESLQNLRNKICELEKKLNELLQEQTIKNNILRGLNVSEEEQQWEYCAILGQVSLVNTANETQALAQSIALGKYSDVVYNSAISHRLFNQPSQDVFDKQLQDILTSSDPSGPRKVMYLAASLLQLYVQINYTGPPFDLNHDNYPLPFARTSVPTTTVDQDELVIQLRRDAKAASLALGKDQDIADLDPFARFHSTMLNHLEVNGEEIYALCKGLHFLDLAQYLFTQLGKASRNHILPSSLPWWRARLCTVWQESLDSRIIADTLQSQCEICFQEMATNLQSHLPNQEMEVSLLSLLYLERGVSAHKFQQPQFAKECFNKALKDYLHLDLQLSGALGKRTKFQVEEKSQLILLASTNHAKNRDAPNQPESKQEDEASSAETLEKNGLTNTSRIEIVKTEEQVANSQFGTMLEAGGVVKVQLSEIDAETPLHERIQYVKETDADLHEKQHGKLSELQLVAILAICLDVKNSYAMEKLTSEEMLTYCERVLEHPNNWTIHSSALLTKSRLEFDKFKTKERAVLQMQLLVDQQRNQLTVLQPFTKVIEQHKHNTIERTRYVYAALWPHVYRLTRSLGDRYREMGVLMSALHCFQELRQWDDCVDCLVKLDKRHRAEALVKERLEVSPESPALLVTLGELTKDESLLERAWEVSRHRYARAKRLLGIHCYERQEFAQCCEHFQQALEVNAQFPAGWFRLGAAAMRIRNYQLARQAFVRVVSLEPEDAEAWANVGTCLVQLNEIPEAFHALKQAIKYGNLNTKIWESFLTLALEVNDYNYVLEAMDHLIDLYGRKSGSPTLDVSAFMALTTFACSPGASPFFRDRYEALLTKVKKACRSDGDVWAIMSEYYEYRNLKSEKRECLLKRVRALNRDEEVETERVTKIGLVGKVCLTLSLLLREFGKDDREVTTFVLENIRKIQGRVKWKEDNAEPSEQEARKRFLVLLETYEKLS